MKLLRFVKQGLCLLLLLFLLVPFGFAIDKNDYYIMDSVTYYGVRLDNYGIKENCVNVNDTLDGKLIQLTPYQVSEYCIAGKLLYVAKDIYLDHAWKRVFLEKKVVGTFSIYHYQDKKYDLFYLQREGELMIELPRKSALGYSFRKQLAEFSKDNPMVASTSISVDYNMKSIVTFLKRYNGASIRLVPKMSAGVSFGANLTKLKPLALYDELDFGIFNFQYNTGATIGAFLDKPITNFGLSVHVALNLTNAAFTYNQIYQATDYDFVANLHTLEFPVHLRYTYPYGVIRPYLEGGGLITWNFKNTNLVQQTLLNGTQVEYQGVRAMDLIDNHYWGSSIGCGVEWPLNGHTVLFLEGRYEKCTGLSNPNLIGLSSFNLTTGLSF